MLEIINFEVSVFHNVQSKCTFKQRDFLTCNDLKLGNY